MVAHILIALLALAGQDQDVPVAAGAVAETAPVATAEPEVDPDPVICRSRMVASSRIGERNRRVQTCKPRSEWAQDNRSRMRR